MRTNDIKEYLSSSAQVKATAQEVNKTLISEPIQLASYAMFGKVYFTQPIGMKERLIVKAMISQVAKSNRITDHKVRRDLRRYLNVSSVLRLNLGQYEKAVDYLVSRAH